MKKNLAYKRIRQDSSRDLTLSTLDDNIIISYIKAFVNIKNCGEPIER